jgi:hypothetical protein
VAYIIGLPDQAAVGGPARVVEGRATPRPGEALIDRSIAVKAGVGMGDTVKILGRTFTIAGLTTGTLNLVSSVAFISMEEFKQARGGSDSPSFLLVRAQQGVSPADLAARIEAQVSRDGPTTADLPQERRVIRDMSTTCRHHEPGPMIGLAVAASHLHGYLSRASSTCSQGLAPRMRTRGDRRPGDDEVVLGSGWPDDPSAGRRCPLRA